MSEEFVWPSDRARAESSELNRVCEELEDALDDLVSAETALAQMRQQLTDARATDAVGCVTPKGENDFGLDARYFHEKLRLILRDINSYTPTEMARALGRLAISASSGTMREPEFNIVDLVDEPKYRTHPPAKPESQIPDWVFDGYAVYSNLSELALKRTGPENVSDTLDAVKHMLTNQESGE